MLAGPAGAQPVAPLAPLAYQELAPNAIRPTGWLRTQLEIMRDHSTGHLDETYPKLRDQQRLARRYRRRLGGNALLARRGRAAGPPARRINRLLAKVQRYVDWSLTHQRPSGYFGPLHQGRAAGRQAPGYSGHAGRGLVAAHGDAQGVAAVLPGHARCAGYSLPDQVLPLPARQPEGRPAGPVERVEHGARRR
ncbi:MAG: hypothetical protein WKG07_16650 [Hymenobacter sp.]